MKANKDDEVPAKIEQTVVDIDSHFVKAAVVLENSYNGRPVDLPITPAVPADLKGDT